MFYFFCRGDESKVTKRLCHLYADISQLRSLWVQNCAIPFIPITATEVVINAIVKNLEFKTPLKIIASPHCRNIRYSVVNVENDDPVNVCMPLVNELKSKGKEMDRAMVFCQRLNHVRLLYRFIDNEMINAGVAAKCYEKYQGNTEENVKKNNY